MCIATRLNEYANTRALSSTLSAQQGLTALNSSSIWLLFIQALGLGRAIRFVVNRSTIRARDGLAGPTALIYRYITLSK
jgi:hypothetical protein